MPSKNNLPALKRSSDKAPILPADNDTRPPMPELPKAANTGTPGRPAKPKAEKRSHKVQLSLTPSEGAKLAEKAGLAGEATYLYAKLKEMGIFE